MKRIIALLSLMFAVLAFFACTADYDTFESSHYKVFKNIAFEEQDGEASFSESEHIIKITTVAPAESLETWDSLTIGYISASNLATLHLVDGKFREFPGDSAGLDSLAQEVSYVKKSLQTGDKIRIPKSQVIYLMLVAENGDPSIWKVEFTIPGVEKEESSSSDADDAESSSSSEENVESSSSSEDDFEDESSSSVEVVLDSNVSFIVYFDGGFEPEISNDTVFVTFPKNTDLSTVALDSTKKDYVYRKSSVDVDPASVKDWTEPRKFVVTAESGKTQTWTVIVKRILNDAALLQLWFANQHSAVTKNDTIAVKLNSDQTLEDVKLDSVKVSEGATVSPNPDSTKWAAEQTFKVTAENGTEKNWIVVLTIADPEEEPASTEHELISISARNQIEDATIDAEAKTIVIHMQKEEEMSRVELTLEISEKASSTLQESVDLRSPVEFTITAEDGVSCDTWTVSADYVKSSEANIDKFTLDVNDNGFEADVVIDADAHMVTFDVAYKFRKNLESLVFDAVYSDRAKSSVTSPLKLTGVESVDGYAASAVIPVEAEDGTVVEWTVKANVEVASNAADIYFRLSGVSAQNYVVDSSAHKITFEVVRGTDLSQVAFKARYSPEAVKKSPAEDVLDLSSLKGEIVVTAENGTDVTWNVEVIQIEPPAPRIKSMKIAGQTAVVDSVEEDGKWFHWVHCDDLPFLADLSNVAVSDIDLSAGATIEGVSENDSYDLSYGRKVTVTNSAGESLEYEIRAGYQLPNSDFSAISYPDVWNNANQTIKIVFTINVITAESVAIGSGKGVRLKTDEKASKIASGSIYTADFNPNNVSALSLASFSDWPDGNELIDFGKKFNARPQYVEFLASYDGKGDSCDIYIVLENRTGDKNVNRTADDVNKLVASAWYRSTSMDNTGRPNPDVVSISSAENGMTRVRMKLQYGTPLENSPIYNSSALVEQLASKQTKAIDNHMVQGTGEEPVTHIRMVFASSGDGQHYKGVVGATLIVDEMRLIY